MELQHDEISIPFLEEGEEIIITRSPLINSNGVITLKNKHLPEMLDGCVYIHPKTAMDNMQCDFDGDLLAFSSSKDFPHLAAEVKDRNLPENRYPDIIKRDKVPYKGSFEEIAISAMENKIGIIANEIQKNMALQCEICAMPQAEKFNYLQKVSAHFSFLVKSYEEGKLQIPEKILQQMHPITLLRKQNINNYQVSQTLKLVKKIFKDCVAELGNELQVAADGAKSALRPNDSIIQYCQAITGYKEVEWLADKKNQEAFTNHGMRTNGYSPIDLMIKQTNQIFEENQLVARPIEQFRKLYPGVKFTDEQKEKAQQIKNEYNSQIKNRIELADKQKNESGPYLVITSPSTGKQLEVTNLIKFNAAKNSDFWKASELSIQVRVGNPTEKMPHTLFAQGKFIDSDGKEVNVPIGTISMKSMKEYNIQPGMSIQQGKVEFHFGISDEMVDTLKQQTREYIESIRQEIPETEKLQLAAAIHDISHTGESKNYSGLKKAGVAFSVFPEHAQAQLQNLQFTEMRVIGTQFNECAGRNFAGEKVAVKFMDDINPREPTKTARWVAVEGKKLGVIDTRSPHLLSGCEAVASITSSPSNSIIVTSLKNPENKLQIDRVNQYAFANHNWQGERTNITLDVRQTDSRKAPVVFAKIGNQVLGVLNKQSVDFLTQQLASKGRTIQGLTIAGTVNKAPPSYADIVIDPNSVKFPDIQLENQNQSIATVAIIAGAVDPKFQAKTEQVLCNMLERAVKRAVESGFEKVQFVDVSPNPTPQIAEALQQIAGEYKDIRVEFIGKASLEEGMKLLKQSSDIVLGVKTAETVGIIQFMASRGKAIATYIPETGGFERYNLPLAQKAVEVAEHNLQSER
ncbi:hypothetical protein [Brunnivagina elsteri]|uniref:hypothetical protein n=1 Tax=Brunnivagina elsteri TaxID=1247191 RepID=UPI001FE85292|nr:hypothetical protein [Calothrix elsteri]